MRNLDKTFANIRIAVSIVKQAIKTVVDKCGPLRAVVNTAGIMKIAGTLSDTGEAHSLSLFEEITKVQFNLS